ncbi:MAG TPA: DUF2600 family protein [Solirubrobacteraceae bacterium]
MAVTRTSPPADSERPDARLHLTGDRRLAARALYALGLANARYWSTVALTVRRQMRHWERRAQAVQNSELRALALSKLHSERFNAEAVAIAATLAPAVHRRDAVRAIVALELMFDYLDGLTERPCADPLVQGAQPFQAFLGAIDAFAQEPTAGTDAVHAEIPQQVNVDGRDAYSREALVDMYLHELAHAVTVAIASLPAGEAVAPVAQRCATRAAEAQIRMHAAASLGIEQLQRWADRESRESDLEWREHLAGAAASVLALHALITAAADPRTTAAEAQRIDEAYLCICAVVTLLDGLVDHHRDNDAGELSYICLYEGDSQLSAALVRTAREASVKAARLRHGAHHVMMLAGAIAYGASAPGAREDPARSALRQLRRQLPPFVPPAVLLLRAWRAGSHAHAHWRKTSTPKT